MVQCLPLGQIPTSAETGESDLFGFQNSLLDYTVMAHINVISLLALRRFLQRASSADRYDDIRRCLFEGRDAIQSALAKASRHMWLSLEIALAGPSVWEQATSSVDHSDRDRFRQQMESLLDLLNLAGLEMDNADARRQCRHELRSARHAALMTTVNLDESTWKNEVHSCSAVTSASDLQESEWHSLWQAAGDLQQSGYPHLAGLVSLRSMWDEPFCVGVVYFLLCRTLSGADSAWNVDHASHDHCWRCLEMSAQMLGVSEDALVALLDRSPAGHMTNALRRSDPEAVEKLRQLGMNRFLHGDYPQAAVHFTAALKLDPTNADLYAQRGDAYRLQCEYERAIADFHLALQLKPASAAFLINRAIAYQQLGEFEQSVTDCSAALTMSPTNAVAYRTRAAAYGSLNEYDLALADLTEAITLAPEDETAFFQRGAIYNKQRQFDLAIADFNRVLQLNPHHILAYLRRGHAHLCRGEFSHAVSNYSEVLQRHSSNVRALTNRGRAFQLQGNHDRGITDFTEALRLEPHNARVYCLRGMLYRSKGDLDLAKADLDESIQLQPVNAAAHYHRAKIHLAQGQFDQALIDLNETLRLQPNLIVGLLSRAVVYDRLGQYSQGLADTARAIEINANAPVAYLARGVVHSHMSDCPSAISDLSQAIALDARLTLAYQLRSLAFSRMGEYDQALADCNHVIALEPRNAQMYVNRSLIYHNKGELQLALLDYTLALQIDPKCLVTAWDQGQAETERGQVALRISDYIDGIRAEPVLAEPPPSNEFVILIEHAGSNGATTHSHQAAATALTTHPIVDVQAEPEPDSTHSEFNILTQPDKPRKTVKRRRAAEAATPTKQAKSRIQRSVIRNPKQDSGKAPVSVDVAEQVEPDEVSEVADVEQEIDSIDVDQEVDAAIDDLLSEPSEGSVEDEDTLIMTANATSIKSETEPAGPSAMEPVECTNCRSHAIPAETLPGGRVRCRSCRSVFLPQSSLQDAYAAALQPPKKHVKTRVEYDDGGFMQKWRKPITIAVGLFAALLAIYFLSPVQILGKSDQVAVFPVHGKVDFEGEPIPNANITLHPIGEKDSQIPRPRGVVHDDGSFTLSTYAKNDGAPPGEYKVTVQWFTKLTIAEMENGLVPKNLLPAQYANAQTSTLSVQIREGDNHIPTLHLKK